MLNFSISNSTVLNLAEKLNESEFCKSPTIYEFPADFVPFHEFTYSSKLEKNNSKNHKSIFFSLFQPPVLFVSPQFQKDLSFTS